MQDFLFMIYACEEQKKEDFINALAREPDPNDEVVQHEIASSIGLDIDMLSQSEIDYIEREVAKRWAP